MLYQKTFLNTFFFHKQNIAASGSFTPSSFNHFPVIFQHYVVGTATESRCGTVLSAVLNGTPPDSLKAMQILVFPASPDSFKAVDVLGLAFFAYYIVIYNNKA